MRYFYEVHSLKGPYDNDNFYELPNGCDLRNYRFLYIREVNKELYNRIKKDDERFLKESSKELKTLKLTFGWRHAWHNAFKAQTIDEIKEKYGKEVVIIGINYEKIN